MIINLFEKKLCRTLNRNKVRPKWDLRSKISKVGAVNMF